MEKLKVNPILEFNKNQLQTVRKEVGYEDVNKLKQDIKHLSDWIKMQNHFRVKEFDDGFLERLLIYNKGSIERTKQRFDQLCTCTNLMPEFLQNFDIKNEFKGLKAVWNFGIAVTCIATGLGRVQQATRRGSSWFLWQVDKGCRVTGGCDVILMPRTHGNLTFIMPKPTDDNYRVLIAGVTGKDDDNYDTIHFYRMLIMLGHYMLNHDYCFGYEWIGDLRNLTFSTATKVNPVIVHKALTLITKAMGQRIKKIHMLSGHKYFDLVMNLLKQGLSAKLKGRLLVHSNLESLHKHVSKDLLPKELGGYGASYSEVNELNFKELSSDDHVAKVKFIETISTDESQRLACEFNEEYSGTPGSFKVLCVD